MLSILSVRLLFGCTLACQLVGFGIMIAGVVILLDPTTLYYIGRVLAFDKASIPGVEIAYAIPVAFGAAQSIPMIIIICFLCFKKHHRKLLIAFIVIEIILLSVQFPTTMAPLILLNGTTRSNFTTALGESLNSRFVGLPQSSTENRAYGLIWDKLMVNQKCCGLNGITDFNTNFGKYASLWYGYYRRYILLNTTIYSGSTVKIPASCCKLAESSTLIQTGSYEDIQVNLLTETCPLTMIASHANQGCLTLLFDALNTYTLVMCILLLMVEIVQAVAIGAAFSSMKEINSVAEDSSPRFSKNTGKQPRYGNSNGYNGNSNSYNVNSNNYNNYNSNIDRYAPSPISYNQPQPAQSYNINANNPNYYRPQPSQGRFGY